MCNKKNHLNRTSKVPRFCYLMGPTGPTGSTGPTGPVFSPRSAYLVTFNPGNSEDGIEIAAGGKLPIDRKEIDITNLITLNSSDNTLSFNTIGYYKIAFVVSAYVQATDIEFNPHRDFVALGFSRVNSDNIYIGASEWVYDETATQIIGQGIIAIDDTSNIYSLNNVSKYAIHLNTPDITDIGSDSYFTNSLVTITIEYLGR